jgi:uncharacterized membrane protein YfcA
LGGFFVKKNIKMSFDFSVLQWSFVLIASFIIGLSKAGIKGIDMLNVLLMATVFGGKASTGVVLPLLCIADIIAVIVYKRNVEWIYFKKLMPAMLIGVLLAVWVGNGIDEAMFKKIISVIIILTIVLMLFLEKTKNAAFPSKYWFSGTIGLISGFTTMMGNLAGAFSNIYFLALKLDKKTFIGTAAWVFLVINLFKLPFQVFVWKNVNQQTFLLDIVLLPALFLGFYVGLKLLGRINENMFRKLVMIITFLGSLLILFR